MPTKDVKGVEAKEGRMMEDVEGRCGGLHGLY